MRPRRFVTREELVAVLRRLGDELGRPPTARDLDERRGAMPSKSLYWHTFGSLSSALAEAGFDVAVGEERLERAIAQGAALARRIGRLPKFADWVEARKTATEPMLTEWRSTGCSSPGAAPGPRSSSSCARGCARKASPSRRTERLAKAPLVGGGR